MISFDTNVLIYSIQTEAGVRHRIAAELVERAIRRDRCTQTLQSLCEFFNVATRKTGLPTDAAALFVERWTAIVAVEPAAPADLAEAMRAVGEYRLPFWDAMLWATARRAGARYLISEDFQDGRLLEGVRIVNPFVAGNAALIEAALAG